MQAVATNDIDHSRAMTKPSTLALSLRHPSSRCLLPSQARRVDETKQGTITTMPRQAPYWLT